MSKKYNQEYFNKIKKLIPKKTTQKDKEGKLIDKPEIEILGEKKLELDNQIQTLDQEILTRQGLSKNTADIYSAYSYIKRTRQDYEAHLTTNFTSGHLNGQQLQTISNQFRNGGTNNYNWNANITNQYSKNITTGVNYTDNLYQLDIGGTNHEITEEQLVSIIARICHGLSTIDDNEFKAKFNAWDTNPTNQTDFATHLGTLTNEGKLVKTKDKNGQALKTLDLASSYTKDDNAVYTTNNLVKGPKNGKTLVETLTKDNTHHEVVSILGKGEFISVIAEELAVMLIIEMKNIRVGAMELISTRWIIFREALSDEKIDEKKAEKVTKEAERNNLKTEIDKLIADELTSRRTTLATYKITDGFEDKTSETNGKDNRRTSDDLTKIKELLEDIRFLENADTSQSSSDAEENTAYAKLETLLSDYQNSKLFKFIIAEGSTNDDKCKKIKETNDLQSYHDDYEKWDKLIKFSDRQRAELQSIAKALGKQEDPNENLPTYQTELKKLDPTLTETTSETMKKELEKVLESGKLKATFKTVMTKADKYDQETDSKKEKTAKIIKMNMNRKPEDANPTDEEITTGLYKLAVGEYSQKTEEQIKT
ncbi:8231_t:CDS:2 [Cetraspora pellucida]|uniref:8231_t:CDS:1 n=1 Tax=Cetraspora pellucida TaxID=1433469 RepID=A0ACA9L2J0_9GLOM|nr:8231_t:CDS:2 [Cetraspora pellucida]